MKPTGTIITISCILAAAGLAVCVAFERQAQLRLVRENTALRQQFSQMDQFVVESQSVPNPATQTQASPSGRDKPVEAPSAMQEQAEELARLRREVAALRQQAKEIETLRADTRVAPGMRETGRGTQTVSHGPNSYRSIAADGSEFEILKAEYGTGRTNMDVAAELFERTREGRLKAIASNNLKGDPEFGQVKRLTVVYRFRGVTMTNEFREGDFVVLPSE